MIIVRRLIAIVDEAPIISIRGFLSIDVSYRYVDVRCLKTPWARLKDPDSWVYVL